MNIPNSARWVVTVCGIILLITGVIILGSTFNKWYEYPATTMASGGGIMLFVGLAVAGLGVATAISAWSKPKDSDNNGS